MSAPKLPRGCPECGEDMGRRKVCSCGYAITEGRAQVRRGERPPIDWQCAWRHDARRCHMAGTHSHGDGRSWCAYHHGLYTSGAGAARHDSPAHFEHWREAFLARLPARKDSVWRAPVHQLWQWLTGQARPPLVTPPLPTPMDQVRAMGMIPRQSLGAPPPAAAGPASVAALATAGAGEYVPGLDDA